jgi:hypothetical protein
MGMLVDGEWLAEAGGVLQRFSLPITGQMDTDEQPARGKRNAEGPTGIPPQRTEIIERAVFSCSVEHPTRD